jgi:hypothetical protein
MKVYRELKNQSPEEVHTRITCDGCGMTPIRGIRYKCTQRHDYDLCSACEARDTEHTFLKIRKAAHAPANLICHYARSGSHFPNKYVEQVINLNDLMP